MNKKLLNIYESNWEKLLASMQDILNDEQLEEKPTNPLLLYINEEEYQAADIKIMVYGQETNDWEGLFQSDIEKTLTYYDEFLNQGECWNYGGQFWNGVSRFISLLQEKYPNKKISLVWNNLVKIGKYNEKGFPPDYIYEAERNSFNVAKDELKILQPNIVLFLTGPNYDSVIHDNFGALPFSKLPSSFSERALAKVTMLGIPFAFRTYHPNFLWRNDINAYFNAIIDKINMYNKDNISLWTMDELKAELEQLKERKSILVQEQKFELASRLRDYEKSILDLMEFKS
jgi:hypothetical protein